jgi:prepilin-type N-terminal cleavage/methylation domain-containing protein
MRTIIQSKQAGFTLVELLAVCAILGAVITAIICLVG